MMDNSDFDFNRSVMLDGNACAGLLQDIFAKEMTTQPAQCASCGNQGELGSLLAFVVAPGLVLRCPVCEKVVLRIVVTPTATYLDARGAAFLRLGPG